MSPTALEQEDHNRDAAFNKAMHGTSAKARGGMTAMLQKDKAAQQAAVDEYFKHWDNKAAADETEETRKVRCAWHEIAVTATDMRRNDETSTPP
jgi:sterol 24-C-methyltransferase